MGNNPPWGTARRPLLPASRPQGWAWHLRGKERCFRKGNEKSSSSQQGTVFFFLVRCQAGSVTGLGILLPGGKERGEFVGWRSLGARGCGLAPGSTLDNKFPSLFVSGKCRKQRFALDPCPDSSLRGSLGADEPHGPPAPHTVPPSPARCRATSPANGGWGEHQHFSACFWTPHVCACT